MGHARKILAQMDNLEKQLLLRDLDRYGYSLVQPESSNASETLSRMLRSDEGRLLEGIPVVLTNVLMNKHKLDLEDFEESLPNALQRRFRILAALTYFFLLLVPDSDYARTQLGKYLKKREPALLEQVQQKVDAGQAFNLAGGVSLDSQRLQNTYENYVVSQLIQSEENLSKKLDSQRQMTFLESLAELFTERQRLLLFKQLNKEQLSKTEREYYSRTIKPRLKALSNKDVRSLAAALLGL